jgi:hypothetical protein
MEVSHHHRHLEEIQLDLHHQYLVVFLLDLHHHWLLVGMYHLYLGAALQGLDLQCLEDLSCPYLEEVWHQDLHHRHLEDLGHLCPVEVLLDLHHQYLEDSGHRLEDLIQLCQEVLPDFYHRQLEALHSPLRVVVLQDFSLHYLVDFYHQFRKDMYSLYPVVPCLWVLQDLDLQCPVE